MRCERFQRFWCSAMFGYGNLCVYCFDSEFVCDYIHIHREREAYMFAHSPLLLFGVKKFFVSISDRTYIYKTKINKYYKIHLCTAANNSFEMAFRCKVSNTIANANTSWSSYFFLVQLRFQFWMCVVVYFSILSLSQYSIFSVNVFV